MIGNIGNPAVAENTPAPLQDKRAETQEQVKKEQESFQKLIEQKAEAAQNSQAAGAKSQNNDKSQSKDAGAVGAATQKSQESKTLADVKNLSESKGLGLQSMNLEKSNPKDVEQAGAGKAVAGKVVDKNAQKPEVKAAAQTLPAQAAVDEGLVGTQSLLAQKAASSAQKEVLAKADLQNEPLAKALKEITQRDLKERKSKKPAETQYKREKGGEKVAIINRGRGAPKNVAEANIRNDKRDEAYKMAFEKFGVKENEEEAGAMQSMDETKKKP